MLSTIVRAGLFSLALAVFSYGFTHPIQAQCSDCAQCENCGQNSGCRNGKHCHQGKHGCRHAGCRHGGSCAHGRCAGHHHPNARHSTTGDVFYNYYVGGAAGVPAQMYLSPRPVPPLVGYTYITYQPLMPHEFLYSHSRRYYSQPAGAANVRTTVHWR